MAYALHVYIFDGDTIGVEHIFYGETEDEAWEWYDKHLGACEYFRAHEESALIEMEDVGDDVPSPEDFEPEEGEEAEPDRT
jgi:hypothetical protein